MGKRNHTTASTEEDVLKLQQISHVENTDKCTLKWLLSVDRFCEIIGYDKGIKKIDTAMELDDYKAESVHNCYASIAHYLKENSEIKPCKLWDFNHFEKMSRMLDDKMKKLQNAGLEKTKQASALSAKKIVQILEHKTMQLDTNKALLEPPEEAPQLEALLRLSSEPSPRQSIESSQVPQTPQITQVLQMPQPLCIPILLSSRPSADPRSHLGDISNHITTVTYEDIRNLMI
ncbi:138_t:CDS:2, partial [Racocetra fulgida]